MIFNMDKPTVCMTIYHYSQRMLNWKKRRTSHRICFEAKKKKKREKSEFQFLYTHKSRRPLTFFVNSFIVYLFALSCCCCSIASKLYGVRITQRGKQQTHNRLPHLFFCWLLLHIFLFFSRCRFFLILFDKIKQKQERHSAQQQRIYR